LALNIGRELSCYFPGFCDGLTTELIAGKEKIYSMYASANRFIKIEDELMDYDQELPTFLSLAV
jgi:hypothetical protein